MSCTDLLQTLVATELGAAGGSWNRWYWHRDIICGLSWTRMRVCLWERGSVDISYLLTEAPELASIWLAILTCASSIMSTWPSLSALIEQLDLLAEQVIYLNCKTNRCTIIGYRDSFSRQLGTWPLLQQNLIGIQRFCCSRHRRTCHCGFLYRYTYIGENTAGSAGRLYLADWDSDRTLSDEPEAGASSQNEDDGRGVSVGREGETDYGE